ncbi:MAG: MFS transporter [Rickettsiaceae bacterium]|nr:MFS transporter [Rickettsiaceae bacterium]
MIFQSGQNLSYQNGNLPIYDKKTFKNLVAFSLACFFYGISAGINLASFALFLSKYKLPTAEITGILSVELIGNLCMAPFMVLLTRKLGIIRLVLISLILRNIFLLIFAFGGNIILWEIGMFGFGLFGFSLYSAIFQRINIIALNTYRGTYLSIASVLFGLGISLGPIFLSFMEIGLSSYTFVVSALASFLMILPIGFVDEIKNEKTYVRTLGIAKIIKYSHIPIMCAIASQFVFFSIVEFLPLYTLEFDKGHSEAYMLLSYFSLSGLILGIPIGMFIDKYDRVKIIMFFALCIATFIQLIPFAMNDSIMIFLVFSPLSACINGTIIAGLAILGDKFRGDDFVAANSTTQAMSMIGGYAGILGTGRAIDVVGGDGLIFSVASVFLVFFAMLIAENYLSNLRTAEKK